MFEQKWCRLIEIHNHAKALFLYAEEIDREFKDFLQPALELKHALEHIIRAKAAALGVSKEPDVAAEEYAAHSYDKAIGHEYRAFFDAADWVSVRLREIITDRLKPFSQECISAVLPDYYKQLRPQVEKICREIARIRGDKDIAKGNNVLDEVCEYQETINEPIKIREKIDCALPGLLEWKAKGKRREVVKWLVAISTGVFLTLVVKGLSMFLFGSS